MLIAKSNNRLASLLFARQERSGIIGSQSMLTMKSRDGGYEGVEGREGKGEEEGDFGGFNIHSNLIYLQSKIKKGRPFHACMTNK